MRLNLGHSWKHRSRFTVVGPAAQLQQAFESGTPVTLTGDCDGDRVYLGISRQTHGDMGLTMETLALDAHLGEGLASYLIDTQRLADAPQLGAIVAREQARADRIDAEVAAQDDRYLNPDYE